MPLHLRERDDFADLWTATGCRMLARHEATPLIHTPGRAAMNPPPTATWHSGLPIRESIAPVH